MCSGSSGFGAHVPHRHRFGRSRLMPPMMTSLERELASPAQLGHRHRTALAEQPKARVERGRRTRPGEPPVSRSGLRCAHPGAIARPGSGGGLGAVVRSDPPVGPLRAETFASLGIRVVRAVGGAHAAFDSLRSVVRRRAREDEKKDRKDDAEHVADDGREDYSAGRSMSSVTCRSMIIAERDVAQ
jgi:hypothetical protein